MANSYFKTKYIEEGNYGIPVEKTLYTTHIGCVDIVNIYDENGSWILTIQDTVDNNILDAINRLYAPTTNTGEIVEKSLVERSSKVEIESLHKSK